MSKDEILITLLKAKERIVLYAKEKNKNKNNNFIYNGISEQLDDIINDYIVNTEIPIEEILECFYILGADQENSIYYDEYCTLKKGVKL